MKDNELKAAATVLTDEVRAAMKRAYNLGQTYWQQADSECRFIELTDEICSKVERLAHAGVTAEPAGLVQSNETDISAHLRQRAAGAMASQDDAKLMLTAADECDRFYNGMMNWKANAQAKDRTIIELRETSKAAQVPAAEVRAQVLAAQADAIIGFAESLADHGICSRDFIMRFANGIAERIRSSTHQSTADKASEVRAARHPVQPLVIAERGRIRFKRNHIVEHLAEGKLNDLATMGFPQEDWEQLAQLIGYSLDGFGTLSYVTDETYERAAAQEPIAAPSTADSANTGALGEKGAEA